MRASARELLVPFLTPLVWRDRGANPRSTAPEADALTTRLSGPVIELISKFNVGLNSLLHQGLSEPEFYGDLQIQKDYG